jgi:aerobic carbon-monoxide dehydrogenase medium subunit
MRDLREYRIATSPAEAVAMLKAGPGRGRFIAGGTDLYLGGQDYDFVVDINQAGLSGISKNEQGDILIGSATPLQDCFKSDLIKNFAGGEISTVAGQCGNRPVRTTATIGGNLCNALPSADMAPVLMALDAVCFLVDVDSQESLPLTEFFLGPRKTVLDGRLLAGLVLPNEAAGWSCQSYKLTRSAEDISLVQVAVALEIKDHTITTARIALGAVAPRPMRSQLAEELLVGLKLAEITPNLLEDVAVIAASECEPIDDHRASSEYRRDMVRVFTKRLICRVLAEEGLETCRGNDFSDGDGGGAA